ncbi:hypothetical protein F7725_027194 [Dissostichus mawsoni]|uniref:WWC1-like helical hairpin domain-containing protein n=1 Tax=Dissostichus mawsoni TaxID=36200 RepID=A0A7J5XC80_DISMA|nr:hypothetical protein F7725_027194 [Dissostichus mawsoni]
MTQIENPRTQWRQEQERMLKEYLVVAQEALEAKKEIAFRIVVQREIRPGADEGGGGLQEGEDSCRSSTSRSRKRTGSVWEMEGGFLMESDSTSGRGNTRGAGQEVALERGGGRERRRGTEEEEGEEGRRGGNTAEISGSKFLSTSCQREASYLCDKTQPETRIDRQEDVVQSDELQAGRGSGDLQRAAKHQEVHQHGREGRQDLIQCLAKLTVNFQNSGEVGNAGNAGGSELQFCDTGCQTDLIGEYGSQDSSHLVDKVKVNWQYEEAKNWTLTPGGPGPGLPAAAEEKEALLQELEEVIRQQICPETLLQLEEERGRLEGEVQRANSSQSQGANQRILQQEKRNALLRQLEEATRITTYLHSQLKSMSASSLTVSSSSSRGSLASSRGSLASSRGTRGGQGGASPALPAAGRPPSHSKNKRSHDPPQSLASLLSLLALLPFTPRLPHGHALPPPPDCPLTQMTEERGAGLTGGAEGRVCPPTGTTGVTLRGNSANRSVRRARRVSVSEEALATDSGVFEAWGRRTEESDEISFIKDMTSVSEPTQIHLGLLWELSSQSLRLHLLQLKNLNRCVVREGFKNILNFNEGFRIPVSSGALTASFLQISVCSLGGESQEETLGSAQLGLSECEGGVEMVYHWLRVTMLNGAEKSQRRHTENQLEGGEAAQQRRGEASERSWQAESVDSGCSNSTAFTPPTEGPCAEGPCAEGVTSRGPSGKVKVEKGTMTEALIPDPRGGRWGHASPFMRGSTIVRSQTFPRGPEPLYRSDSDSSTLPKKTPFVRNTLERRTLRYKQQSYRSSLAEQPTPDLSGPGAGPPGLQEPAEAASGGAELPAGPEAARVRVSSSSVRRSGGERLRKASKEVLQMRGQSQKEPLPVQTFREKMAFSRDQGSTSLLSQRTTYMVFL